jgi:hypothetical protein
VRDTTKPVITLNGENPVNLEVGAAYIESGATVTDNYDTAIQNKLVISGTVNTVVVGTYYLYYNATDSERNGADEVIRTVNVTDGTAPIVTLSGANPQYLEVKTPYVELGATANDAVDGNLQVTIDSGNVNSNQIGVYYVYYTAIDSANNTGSVTRTVIVRDTTTPILTLNGSGEITLEVPQTYQDEGAERMDNYDGTGIVYGSGIVHYNLAGSYTLKYSYVDTSGNTGNILTRTIHVVGKPSG